MANNPFEQFEKPPETKPEEKNESEEMSKESRFIERLSVLKINAEEMKEEDMEKLKSINEKIEQIDAPWVVRVMDEIKRKGGEEHLLKYFGPEDVETLSRMNQGRGYDLTKEGIASHQAKELASTLMQDKKWQETLGTRAKERIKTATTPAKVEEAKAEISKEELPAETKEAQVAEEKREKTHEEIAGHLLEHPAEALEIFKKGVGLKLEKACLGFANFWEKTGAKALKGLSFVGEKAVGYPAGEMNRTVWTIGEFFEAFPGIKRLNNALQIYGHVERLQKGELTPEQAEQLKKLLELHAHAARGQWQEIAAFNNWHERKKGTLEALRTFGGARKKLETWATGRETETEVKKRGAAGRRTREVAEKF